MAPGLMFNKISKWSRNNCRKKLLLRRAKRSSRIIIIWCIIPRYNTLKFTMKRDFEKWKLKATRLHRCGIPSWLLNRQTSRPWIRPLENKTKGASTTIEREDMNRWKLIQKSRNGVTKVLRSSFTDSWKLNPTEGGECSIL